MGSVVSFSDPWGSAPDPEVFRFAALGTYERGDSSEGGVACAVRHTPGARVAPQQSPIPQECTTTLSAMFLICNVGTFCEGRLVMRRWDGLVDRYIEEYSARGIASETVANNRRELERWGTWMKHRRPRPQLEKIEPALLINYIEQRSAFRSKATVSSVVSTMRCMGEFLVREGYWVQNPFRWIKGPKLNHRSHSPGRISQTTMRQLWEAASTNRQGYSRSLWVTVLAILYGAGIRRGELERLNVSNWNHEEGILVVDGRKTGWERNVVLPDISRQCLESYLVQRHNHLEMLKRLDEKALFVSREGLRLNGSMITQGVRRLTRRAGLEGITIHQFRHTCASDLLEAGLHVAQVQQILGHQSISTTVRYLHVSDPQRAAAIQLHPINDILTRREATYAS